MAKIKTAIFFLSVILLGNLITVSCKKEKPEQSCSTCPTGSPTEKPGFSFSRNGGSLITADLAYFNGSGIFGSYQGNKYRVSIICSQAPGAYSINGTNKVTYTENGMVFNATGGTINITANAGGKISGNFNVTGTGGGFSSVNGQFKDTPQQ